MRLSVRQRDGIYAYLTNMRAPVSAVSSADPEVGEEGASARRGRKLFDSSETGCASCHGSKQLSDGQGHDFGSASNLDSVPRFDTPSLTFGAQSAPYFHDGCYLTLAAMLDDPASLMGHSAQLSENDMATLEVYLRTL